MITFEHKEHYNVRLDGRIIGKILVERGSKHEICNGLLKYQYFPTGQREGGEVFFSLEECKRSLLEE